MHVILVVKVWISILFDQVRSFFHRQIIGYFGSSLMCSKKGCGCTMTLPIKHIALYGGTFCPIQNAHICLALFLQEKFKFDEFRFIPNKEPVLDKSAATTLEHRLAMLELALAPYSSFMIDRREATRSTPSFMINTLKDLREELAHVPCAISLVIGVDNFNEFHRWHDWEKILTLCNLIVIERPGYEITHLSAPLREQLLSHQIHEITDPQELSMGGTGGFYRCNAGLYDISSTLIRDQIKVSGDVGAYLPKSVLDYIKKKIL